MALSRLPQFTSFVLLSQNYWLSLSQLEICTNTVIKCAHNCEKAENVPKGFGATQAATVLEQLYSHRAVHTTAFLLPLQNPSVFKLHV